VVGRNPLHRLCNSTAAAAVADLKSIAGAWRGSNSTGSPVDLIVFDDGRFDATITTPQQALHRNGQIHLEGDQFLYDADSPCGRLTYVEGDGRRRLIMWGTLNEGGRSLSSNICRVIVDGELSAVTAH